MKLKVSQIGSSSALEIKRRLQEVSEFQAMHISLAIHFPSLALSKVAAAAFLLEEIYTRRISSL